jgi:hypothetical protein
VPIEDSLGTAIAPKSPTQATVSSALAAMAPRDCGMGVVPVGEGTGSTVVVGEFGGT